MEELLKYLSADPSAAAAFQSLTNAGGTVYIVGGAVRDIVLDKRPKDIDLMVTGLEGKEVAKALRSTGGKVALTGRLREDKKQRQTFGVYRLRMGQFETEVALPRTDTYDGYTRHPEVATDPNLPIEEDLLRRDFTANAMAYNPLTNEVIDPYGGRQAIQEGRLTMTNPEVFAQDPIRLIRAISAFSKHGLMPDPEMLQAMKTHAHAMKKMPQEAIRDELLKTLSGHNPAEALELAHDTGLLKQFLPELDQTFGFDQRNLHHNLDVGAHTMQVLRHMCQISNDPDLRMAAIMHDVGKPDSFWLDSEGHGHFYETTDENGRPLGANHEQLGANMTAQALKRLRFTNERLARITDVVAGHMFDPFTTMRTTRRFLAGTAKGDPNLAMDLMKIREADSHGKADGSIAPKDAQFLETAHPLLQTVLDQQQAFTLKDLAVNGHDLMELGIQGQAIGTILKTLLDQVIEDPALNERSTLLGIVREMQST